MLESIYYYSTFMPHTLQIEIKCYFFRLRREDSERILRSIADYFPAFGIIGSVVGLITMLGGIGDTSVILKAIPIALTSTLYGLIFANFFFLPFAATIKERTNQEILLQKIIMEGTIAISSSENRRGFRPGIWRHRRCTKISAPNYA